MKRRSTSFLYLNSENYGLLWKSEWNIVLDELKVVNLMT